MASIGRKAGDLEADVYIYDRLRLLANGVHSPSVVWTASPEFFLAHVLAFEKRSISIHVVIIFGMSLSIDTVIIILIILSDIFPRKKKALPSS